MNDRAIEAIDGIADALRACLISQNVSDSNYEPANIVDTSDRLARAAKQIANAITPIGSVAGTDASGGRIASLTEAVVGITAGLFRIADAIEGLADAVASARAEGE